MKLEAEAAGEAAEAAEAGDIFPARVRASSALIPSKKIYYRNTQLLSSFVNREGKIRPRRQTGTCAKHQRQIAVAVKRARHMALLQFAGESLN